MQAKFDVFISYRRDGGEILGRLLFEMLKDNYNIFFDHESLSSGRFDTKLLEIIKDCNDVIVILSAGCLERCSNKEDWFMQEISCALENNKNIILLMTEDFIMPSGAGLLAYPPQIQSLVKYNGYRISVAYIDGVIAKLCHDMKTEKRVSASPFDSLSEWRELSRCLAAREYTDFLPTDMKMEILRHAINAFLDEYNAKIFNSMMERMTANVNNIRPKFRYEIDVNSGFNFRNVDIDTDKYYELSESFSYSKKFLTGAPDKSFWISFATNLDELDAALRDENFFFSENLMIEREDIRLLCALPDDEKEDFYLSAMRTRINVNGTVLSPVKVVIDESGVFGKYELTDEILSASDLFDVKIRFRIPQMHGNNYFFASINEPTFSPFIRFSYPEDEFEVKMIPFLNRSVTAKDTKIFEGLRELAIENEWILPVSGAIFIINEK